MGMELLPETSYDRVEELIETLEGTLHRCGDAYSHISNITGMIKGRFCVCFEMYRFRSARIFSLITP